MAQQNAQALESSVAKAPDHGVRSKKEVQEWMIAMLAELLEVPPEEVDTRKTFERYGLDSSAAIGLTDSLGAWLGCELDPTLLYDYATIDAVSQYLVEIGKVKA